MSVGIGSTLGPLISPAVVENMSMSGSGVSHPGIQPGEPLPFTVYTFHVPFGPRSVEKIDKDAISAGRYLALDQFE